VAAVHEHRLQGNTVHSVVADDHCWQLPVSYIMYWCQLRVTCIN